MEQIHVLGAGFSGSLVAHLLASRGHRVTVYDPHLRARQEEKFEKEEKITPGIGQSSHLHVLLSKGLANFHRFYPTFAEFLEQQKSPTIDWSADTIWESPRGKAPHFVSNIRTRSFSRKLLDGFMLAQIAKNQNIYFESLKIIDIQVKEKKVVSLECSNGKKIDASYVIDCRGRGSCFPVDIGLIKEKTAHLGITYRTVTLKNASLKMQYYYQPRPPLHSDGVVLTPIEHSQAILTSIHYPNSKLLKAPLKDLINTFSNPVLHEAFISASQISKPSYFYFKNSVWRQFGRCNHWPEGLYALGDAVYQLNPVFGQGMTLSTLAIELLAETISQGKHPLTFQKTLDQMIRIPWHLSSGGKLPSLLLNLWMKWAFSSPKNYRSFLERQHMVERMCY